MYYESHYFKAHSPVDFIYSRCIESSLGPEHYRHPPKALTLTGSQPICSPQVPWLSLIYFPSVDLPTLDISYKWNYTVCDPLCLASFM